MTQKPELIKEYLALNEKIRSIKSEYLKPLETRLKEIKPQVKDILLIDGFEEIYYKKPAKKAEFDPKKVYDYLLTLDLPEAAMEEVTIKIADTSKLEWLLINQYIEDLNLPEECYQIDDKSSGSIEIPENRKRK